MLIKKCALFAVLCLVVTQAFLLSSNAPANAAPPFHVTAVHNNGNIHVNTYPDSYTGAWAVSDTMIHIFNSSTGQSTTAQPYDSTTKLSFDISGSSTDILKVVAVNLNVQAKPDVDSIDTVD